MDYRRQILTCNFHTNVLTHHLYPVILFLWFSLVIQVTPQFWTLDPDETKTVRQLVASRGYVLQEYHVLTKDGYIITLHRAVPPDYDPVNYNVFRKPVILFHGVLTDTGSFYMNTPFINSTDSCGDNIGFCLLRTGRYDLWIANARGNRYSRHHLRYSDKDPNFWAFSWDHIAMFDVPAFLDFILEFTGHKSAGYIGYSQGSSTLFAFLSMNPHYGHKIRPFICWAPGVYLNHAKTIIRPILKVSYKAVHRIPGEYIPSHGLINPLLQFPACHHPVGLPICSVLLQLTFGPTSHLNNTRIPTYFHFVPSAISNWQVAHYTQIGGSGQFTRFDYGSKAVNYKAYGKPYAPLWPLWKLPKDLKVTVMYGATDWFVDPVDARRLIRTLRRYGLDVHDYLVPSRTWNHIDFFMGEGAGRLVYSEVIKQLDLYAWDN